MKNRTAILLLVILLSTTWTLTNCTKPSSSAKSVSNQTGTITISGAWALYPMIIRWSEEYQKIYPDVMFDISAGGAGKGMSDVLAGAVDIGMVSREIYSEEIDKGAFWVSVTKDAVFPTINENNPVWDDLSQKGAARDIFVRIFITGEITTWGQMVGSDQVTDPIHVFTRSDACGAAATWAEYLGAAQEDLLGVAVYGDPGLLDAVIKDTLGIGYNNLNYIFDMETGKPVTGAVLLPIDSNNNGLLDPSETINSKEMALKAVATGQYPSPPARNLNLVTKGQPTGLLKDFITWVLTDGQDYIEEAGYIALPKEMLEEELGKLK